jgi:hypothetical protein
LVWIWPVSNRLQSRFFSFFDCAFDSEPEGDPRDFFALQYSGKVLSDNFVLDLELAATYAPMAKALKDAFEALYIHFIGATANQASAPGSSDSPISIGSLKDRYHLLSTHAVGSFLTVACFWIPPLSSANAKGSWSMPVLTIIGAPTTTIDAKPVPRMVVLPDSPSPKFKLQPGSFPGPPEMDWTILLGTTATGMRVILAMGHRSWQEYRQLLGHVWCFSGRDACTIRRVKFLLRYSSSSM